MWNKQFLSIFYWELAKTHEKYSFVEKMERKTTVQVSVQVHKTMIRFMIDYHVWAQTICIHLLLILIGGDDTHDLSVFNGYVICNLGISSSIVHFICAYHAIYLTRNPCPKYIIP